MKRKNELGEQDFAIYEVYYDDMGNVSSWTEKPLTPACPSEEDLLRELSLMTAAFKEKTLDYDKK